MRETVGQWLEPKDSIVSVRICGREGTSATTLAVVAVEGSTTKPRDGDGDIGVSWVTSREEMTDAVVDELESIEPDDYDGWRLYGYDAAGKQKSTLAGKLTAPATPVLDGPANANPWAVLGMLATAMQGMMAEQTKMLREARQTMGSLGDANVRMTDRLGTALQEVVDAEAKRMASETEAYEAGVTFAAAHRELEGGNEEDGPIKAMFAEALGKILPGLVPYLGGPVAAAGDGVDLDAMMARAMTDPAFRERAMAAYVKATAAAEGGGEGGPADG